MMYYPKFPFLLGLTVPNKPLMTKGKVIMPISGKDYKLTTSNYHSQKPLEPVW